MAEWKPLLTYLSIKSDLDIHEGIRILIFNLVVPEVWPAITWPNSGHRHTVIKTEEVPIRP